MYVNRRSDHEVCVLDGCERPFSSRGLCRSHYTSMRKAGRIEEFPLVGRSKMPRSACTFDGCDRPMSSKGLCISHRGQRNRGKELAPIIIRKAGWNPNWAGYLVMRCRKGCGCISQHRIEMERHLGRPLRRGENVHHINGDRTDNRIENLELWNTTQPAGQRAADKLAWAWEIIALYGEETAA